MKSTKRDRIIINVACSIIAVVMAIIGFSAGAREINALAIGVAIGSFVHILPKML